MDARNRLEYVGKIFDLRERQTGKGWMYTFSIPIGGQSKEGEQELTEWMAGIIFTKEQVPLKDRVDAHFTASLEVRPPYGDRPAAIGFLGYFIEPFFGNVYRVSKKHESKEPQHQAGPHDQDEDKGFDKDGMPF